MVAEELENLGKDEDKQRALYLRLKKKFEGSIQEDSSLDMELAVCALQADLDLSENGWKKLRLWILDLIQRGGDLSKLPTYNKLKIYKEKMVPQGLVSNAKDARVTLQVE